jgi:N-acetylmuramoyl-L-alanine amidase
MSRRSVKRLTIFALLVMVSLTAGACVSYSIDERPSRQHRRSRAENSARNALVSLRDAATQWDLDVVRVSERSALVRNSNNLVMLRKAPNGNVIVNKQRLRSDEIVGRNGQLYLPRDLVRRVDDLLRDAPPPPKRAAPSMPLIASRHLSGVTIMLDAGHGGSDPGAPNRHGPVEKTITLDTAQRVKRTLESWGARVIMTRTGDSYPTLNQRVASSDRADPNLFVSLHADSAKNTSAHGFTVYVARKSSTASRKAAQNLERSLKASGISSRGVRKANFRVIADTDDPAVLVEMGYLTNPSEASRLSQPAYRQKLAEAIARGVSATFESRSGPAGSAIASRAR